MRLDRSFILRSALVFCSFFFFQAEDGIRDYKVTGVQTCALPISGTPAADGPRAVSERGNPARPGTALRTVPAACRAAAERTHTAGPRRRRSESGDRKSVV